MTNYLPRGARAAIYVRRAALPQAASAQSALDQARPCQDFADRQGLTVVRVFQDVPGNGARLVGRDGLAAMMAAAEHGEFEMVLVEDLDRLGRNAADVHHLLTNLNRLGVGVWTLDRGAVSNLEVAFAAVQSQQFTKDLARKVRRGQEGAVMSGRISGSVAYGYRKLFSPHGQNGLREIDPDEAVIVCRIFQDYVAGVSAFAICEALNDEGVPAPKSKAWRPGALTGRRGADAGILRNKLYVGEFHWGRTRRERNRKTGATSVKGAPACEHVVAQVPHLRIIDDDLFAAAQARLGARS